MINFEEELKKFYPSLEVEQIEDNIHNKNLTDMVDLMEEMVKETKERQSGAYDSMKCNKCGATLTDSSFCNNCGANVKIYKIELSDFPEP